VNRFSRVSLFLFIITSSLGLPSINAGWLQEDIAVCTDQVVQQGAAISPDSTGGTIVAWEDARNADIYAQRYDASGQELWTPDGVNVSNMAGTQKFPRIVADGSGGAFIVFESDTSTGMICPQGKWYSVVVVAKLDQNGTVDWKKRISDAAATTFYAERRELTPLARPDGRGGAIIAWTTDHDLYIDVVGCDFPDCCSWMARNNYVQRIDADGNLLWGPLPISVCADDNDPHGLVVAVDALGATFLAWCDAKPYYYSYRYIYAQKLDINGNVLWGTIGVAAADNNWWLETPMIIYDGAGGAIIAWRDNTYRMYAQRLDPLGSAVWALGGIPISTSTGGKVSAGILPSGPGTAIVAWTDNASGVPTLFAQRLDAAGNPAWQSNGLMISDGVNTCVNARMALDGENGAVLAWEQIPPEGWLSLRSIWGLSASDIYSVGDGGMILHYNGTAWSTMVSGTTANLSGVWGSAGDDMYAVGKGGLILHYDGISWSPMASGVTTDLNDVWGSSADTIYAVGVANTIVRYDGVSWSAMGAPTSAGSNLLGVHGSSANCAYAVGTTSGYSGIGVLLHYHGTDWHCVYCAYGNYHGVWVSPDSCVYASGLHHDFLYGFLVRYDGANWINTELPIKCTGYGMWGDRSDNVYAVFDKGYVAHFDGEQWTLALATTDLLLDVWGTSGDDVWVVGKHYLIRHFENGAWITQYQAGGDVMVQRLDTLGTRMWAESGAPASVNVDAQTGPSVVYDPPGAALLAWSDNRNGNWDIYARKVSIARGPLVATELVAFAARPSVDGIQVTWQLSRCEDGGAFAVSRSENGGASWGKIAPKIDRSNLSFSFADATPEPGKSYRYRVGVSDSKGGRVLFETEGMWMPALPLTLHQNYPNPFNPSTTIRYYLPARSHVLLNVYDISGRLVARLVNGAQAGGAHSVEWNGENESGGRASSGIYFMRLDAGGKSLTRKVVMMR